MGIEVMTKADGLALLEQIKQLRQELQQVKQQQGVTAISYTKKQAAQLLSCSTQKIDRLVQNYRQDPEARHALEYYKVGSTYRFTAKAIEDYKERTRFDHQAA